MTISAVEFASTNATNHEENDNTTFTLPENGTEDNLTPMQSFYKNKTFFITGGTGFLGKIILDKLLRCCPDIECIYLLIRSKKGKTVEQRIDELFNDPVFDRLKKEVDNFKEKILTISGDCTLPNLGIQHDDRKTLIENVNVIFHCAATVRFDEKLPLAVNINIRATRDLIDMAHEIKNLKTFVHVSTAYSNSNLDEIDEKFYKPEITAENIIKLVECAGDKLSEEISPKVIGSWPNTYTFTKAIAEDYIKRHAKGLPVVVFRPAIVVGTNKEPVPGWIDNLYGPTGIVVGVGAGILRVVFADPEVISDMVPVDSVVNALLASGWARAQQSEHEEIPIYNYVSSKRNPITLERFFELNFRHGRPIASVKAVWCYKLTLTKYKLLYNIYTFLLHILPALLVDTGLVLLRKKPKALKIYKTIHKFTTVLAYFSTKNFKFHDNNVCNLWNHLTPKDQELFDFDITKIDWDQYFKNSVHGLRVFIFKDDISTIPTAEKRMRRFEIAHETIKYTFIAFILYILYQIFSYTYSFF